MPLAVEVVPVISIRPVVRIVDIPRPHLCSPLTAFRIAASAFHFLLSVAAVFYNDKKATIVREHVA